MLGQNTRHPEAPALRTCSASITCQRIGVAFIVLSCVLYFALILVPLMPLEAGTQLALATGLAVSSEGTFWLGCLIAGRSILSRLGRMLWPARPHVAAPAACPVCAPRAPSAST